MNKGLTRVLPLMLIATEVGARAGGAGGGSSSNSSNGSSRSSSSGHSYSSSGISYRGSGVYSSGGSDGGSFVVFLIFAVIILILFYIFRKFLRANGVNFDKYSNGGLDRELNKFNRQNQIGVIPVDFFETGGREQFEKKTNTAFLIIQESWSKKRLDLMRKFITDGVYQRFNAQFTMMNFLHQINVISNVNIHKLVVVQAYREGGYDCVDVAITASAYDQFTSSQHPEMNTPGGVETFTEYWSFIRRVDYQKGSDIFNSDNCPKCAAPLTSKLVETARCPYCSTYLNSGEYDWVLAEISQENDFKLRGAEKSNNVQQLEIVKAYPEFSRQVIEDRASNAFMQILVGIATKNISVLKRFSSIEAFESFKALVPEKAFAYNRLFTKSVELTQTKIIDNKIFCHVDVNYTYERVTQPGITVTKSKEITLMRILSGVKSKGSVFANACPACGAAQKDNLSAVCEYCSSPLNDPKNDWVVVSLSNGINKNRI